MSTHRVALAVLAFSACSGEPPPPPPEPVPEPEPEPEPDAKYEEFRNSVSGDEDVVRCENLHAQLVERLDGRWRWVELHEGRVYGVVPQKSGSIWFKAPWNGPWEALELFWDTGEGEKHILCATKDRQFAALVATPSSPPPGAHVSALGCEGQLQERWPVLQKNNPVLRLDTNLKSPCKVQALVWKFPEDGEPMFANGPIQTVTPMSGKATPFALEPPRENQFVPATEEHMQLFEDNGGVLPTDEEDAG